LKNLLETAALTLVLAGLTLAAKPARAGLTTTNGLSS
jgi:hypothetical protein